MRMNLDDFQQIDVGTEVPPVREIRRCDAVGVRDVFCCVTNGTRIVIAGHGNCDDQKRQLQDARGEFASLEHQQHLQHHQHHQQDEGTGISIKSVPQSKSCGPSRVAPKG